MSAYGEFGPGVVIPLPESDAGEVCDECGEDIEDCFCDEDNDYDLPSGDDEW